MARFWHYIVALDDSAAERHRRHRHQRAPVALTGLFDNRRKGNRVKPA